MRGLAARLAGLRGQIAPIAAISVFGLAISMSYPLIGLLLERMGASGAAIGLNTTAAAVMMVVSAPILPRIMAAVGIGPLLIGAGLALAAIMLAYPIMPDFWWWTFLRLIYGFAATAVFFGSEYWIVAASPAGMRGRIVAAYTMSLSVTFMACPLIIGAVGVEGLLPFALGAAILLAGLVPIVWGLRAAPPRPREAPPHPLSTVRFFVTDPGILWGVVLYGLIEYGAVALLPVWAVRSGHTEGEAAIVMASFAAGSVLFQPAVGWAADRCDRRLLLLVAAVVSLLAPLAMAALSANLAGVILCGLAWGGMAVALYGVALTELGARYTGQKLSEGNAAVVLAYGLGALGAPIGLGLAMDLVPPDGMLLAAAAGALAYGALISVRIARARRGS